MFRFWQSSLRTSFLIRSFGKHKRPRYAAGKNFTKSKEPEGPFTSAGRRVKHFKELKFYHAKNRHGQNQTLVDSNRRDIDFFNPITGGFDKDPRSRYEPSDSEEDSLDDEAAAFADFTDTDDEDIYFGGGNDADGDYDDEGNELRPRDTGTGKTTWADPDPLPGRRREETDSDEDEREFNEIFGKSAGRGRGDDRRQFGRGPQKGKKGKMAFNEAKSFEKEKRKSGDTDPELGIDFESFQERFRRKSEEKKPILEKNFSAENFLKESGDEENIDDLDEKVMREGDDEAAEFNDVSDMIREYDRPRRNVQTFPITEEMVAARRQAEMQGGEEYESDDTEVIRVEDPRLKQEIAQEHEKNIKRLKSTPGGRKMFKNMNAEYESLKDFPPRGKKLYENALKTEGPRRDRKKDPKRSSSSPKMVEFVDKDHPLSKAAKSKRSDSWRALSIDFDDLTEPKNVFSDVEKEKRNQQRQEQIFEKQHEELRGRAPFGGSGIRRYSTSARETRMTDFQIWSEEASVLQQADRLISRRKPFESRRLRRVQDLRQYWESFPSDEVLQEAVRGLLTQLRHPSTVYIAMLPSKRLICGLSAPSLTIRGTSTVDQFRSLPLHFVKVDLKSFRGLIQRGEVITGGPPVGFRNEHQRLCDWTGRSW